MTSTPSIGTPTEPRPQRNYRTLLIIVRKLVYKNCPACVAHRKEDLVQLTIERLLKRMKADGQELTDYNFSFIKNLVFFVMADAVRRECKAPTTGDPAMFESLQVGPACPTNLGRLPDPEARAIAKNTVEVAMRSLDDLSQNRRKAVLLRCVQGHSYTEIEGMTSWSRRTIHNLVHRGRKDLMALLSKKGIALDAFGAEHAGPK